MGNQKFIIEEQKLVREFSAYHTTIIQNISWRIPLKLEVINPSLTDSEIIKRNIDSYKKHSSIKLIEENLSHKVSFHSANASVRDANKIN